MYVLHLSRPHLLLPALTASTSCCAAARPSDALLPRHCCHLRQQSHVLTHISRTRCFCCLLWLHLLPAILSTVQHHSRSLGRSAAFTTTLLCRGVFHTNSDTTLQYHAHSCPLFRLAAVPIKGKLLCSITALGRSAVFTLLLHNLGEYLTNSTVLQHGPRAL